MNSKVVFFFFDNTKVVTFHKIQHKIQISIRHVFFFFFFFLNGFFILFDLLPIATGHIAQFEI